MLTTNSHRTVVKNLQKPQDSMVTALQKQIANAFNLYLNYKHYHWQTYGPFERDLNIIFDEFANEVYSTVEQLAEKVRMMDQNRVRIREFREIATVKPSKKGSDIRGMIAEAEQNVLRVISELREVIKKVSGNDQPLSESLRKILKMHEKHEWWLHYILNRRQNITIPAKQN